MTRKVSLIATFILLSLMLGLAPALAQGEDGGLGAQAALGTAFTYQGQLKQSGNPVNGTCDFTLAGGFWNGVSGPLRLFLPLIRR